MGANFPNFEDYRVLYRRNYCGRSVSEYLDLAAPLTGLAILDLCGGDGCLSLEALKHNPRKIVLVDEQAGMIPIEVQVNPAIAVRVAGAEDFLVCCGYRNVQFDRIFCRQAMNYWCNERSAAQLRQVLAPGGIFIFNTFHEKPPVKPATHAYELEGRSYVEASWLVGDDVHHVQVCEGLPAHYSWCKWIPRDQFSEWFAPYFEVTTYERGKASLYKCTRK